MKRIYVKPAMYVENFALSQSVAKNCGVDKGGNSLGKPQAGSPMTCGWDMGDGDVVWTHIPSCAPTSLEGTDFPINGNCYNNLGNANSIFGWS